MERHHELCGPNHVFVPAAPLFTSPAHVIYKNILAKVRNRYSTLNSGDAWARSVSKLLSKSMSPWWTITIGLTKEVVHA